METLIPYAPLLNFLMIFFIVPIWRLGTAMFQSNKMQQIEITELKKTTSALVAVSMKFLHADAAKEFLKEMARHERR